MDSLPNDVWAFLLAGVAVASFCYAWAVDAVLGRTGFGVVFTSMISEASAYGGLKATDWAITHQKIPYEYATPLGYAGGAFVCVTVTLFVLCFLKQFVIR